MKLEGLEDKHVLITGAADGIGLALAEACLAAGAHVFLSDIAEEKLIEVARRLDAPCAPCDVSDAAATVNLVERAWSELGSIDLLCANAGVFTPGSLLNASQQDIDWIFGVNVWGILNATRPFVEKLRASGQSGHVLMTGSEHSLSNPSYLRSVPCHLYNMTKHSVLSMADSLRAELEPEGIGISVLCPGPIISGLTDNSGAGRPDRFGGPMEIEMASISEEQVKQLSTLYRPASHAAEMAIEGLRRGLFVIPTHAFIEQDAAERYQDIVRGFGILELAGDTRARG